MSYKRRSLYKWLAEQGLREIAKGQILLRATKDQKLVCHDNQRPEGTHPIEEEEEWCNICPLYSPCSYGIVHM